MSSSHNRYQHHTQATKSPQNFTAISAEIIETVFTKDITGSCGETLSRVSDLDEILQLLVGRYQNQTPEEIADSLSGEFAQLDGDNAVTPDGVTADLLVALASPSDELRDALLLAIFSDHPQSSVLINDADGKVLVNPSLTNTPGFSLISTL